MKTLKFISIFLVYIFINNLQGDTLILRSGAAVRGKIVNQTRTQVKINTLDGIKEYVKNDIRRITYDTYDPDVEKAKEEERKKQDEIKKQEELKRQEEERIRVLEEEKRLKEEQKRLEEEARRNDKEFRQKEKERLKLEEKNRKEEERRLREEQEKSELEARKNNIRPSQMIWRSAVLPGYGQSYAGQKTKGTVFTSLFLGSLAVAALSVGDYNKYNRIYKASSQNTYFYSPYVLKQALKSPLSPGDSQFLAYYAYTNENEIQSSKASKRKAGTAINNAATVMAGAYFFGMIDTLNQTRFIGRSKGNASGRSGDVRFALVVAPGMSAAAVSVKF